MDLKKFKNFTKSDEKTDKIEFYGVDKYFGYLKVLKVINYYTLEVVIYNRDKLNKWIFKLNDVDILDDKLSTLNKEYLKKRLEYFSLNKYMRFKIEKYRLNNVEGTIYFEDKMKSSLNIALVNMTINLSVMRKKIKMFEKKEFKQENILNSNNSNICWENINQLGKSLPIIYEESE
jgi:virulence-associated protein VapD